MLNRILTLDGFDVSLAAGGEEGLRAAGDLNPDIVVLDVMMPGKNGLEVMREMRENKRTRDIPILFLSAVSDESVVVQGLKGADDYVLKPFKTLELERRIKNILERSGRAGARPVGGGPAAGERLPVQISSETHLIPMDDILYLEAKGKYCYVYTRDRRYLTGNSVGELEQRFSGKTSFLRVHRSFIVNIKHVNKITRDKRGNTVLAVGGEGGAAVKVSSSYYAAVKERLGV